MRAQDARLKHLPDHLTDKLSYRSFGQAPDGVIRISFDQEYYCLTVEAGDFVNLSSVILETPAYAI